MEAQIEKSICDALTKLGHFVIKLKDQSAYRDGAYRKGTSYQIRGVADLVVFLKKGVTVWLEVKTSLGRQSEAQIAFQKKIESLGHIYKLVRSAKEAVDIISKLNNN